MINYTEAREAIKEQGVSEEIIENLKQIVQSDQAAVFKYLDIYFLGVINGRQKRSKKHQRSMEV